MSESILHHRRLWRETGFVHQLLQFVLMPNLSLRQCVQHWADIAAALAEHPRRRPLVSARLMACLHI